MINYKIVDPNYITKNHTFFHIHNTNLYFYSFPIKLTQISSSHIQTLYKKNIHFSHIFYFLLIFFCLQYIFPYFFISIHSLSYNFTYLFHLFLFHFYNYKILNIETYTHKTTFFISNNLYIILKSFIFIKQCQSNINFKIINQE